LANRINKIAVKAVMNKNKYAQINIYNREQYSNLWYGLNSEKSVNVQTMKAQT